nr:hypothetical protein [Bauldia sp.]
MRSGERRGHRFRVDLRQLVRSDPEAGLGEAEREAFKGVGLGPKGCEHDPVAPGPPETGDQPRLDQGRLAGAGFSEQQDEPPASFDPAGVQSLDEAPHVVIPAEIDRGVVLVEGEEAGIGRSAGWKVEAPLTQKGDLGQAAGELFKAAFTVPRQVQLLQVVSDELVTVRRGDQREDRLAARACLSELGKAPFGIEPVRRQEQDDRLRPLQFVVKPLLPPLAGRDAEMLVDIEKAVFEAPALEPGEQIPGFRIVATGM